MSATISLDILARDRASSVLSKVGSSADKSGTRISRLHGTIGRMAKSSMLHLGALAGVAGIGALVKSSIELEASFGKTMNLVRSATNAPQSSMKAMSALAMKMGAQTQFSANEAADAMLELAKAGISTKDIMGGGLKNTLLLASAGQLDLADAATIASNSMNMFNLHGKDMGRIAAALAGGANKSTASVQSLGLGLSQVGPGARNAGLSLNQTIGVLAAFDQAGIKGSDAGTSLKTMLSRLIPSTKKAKDEMQHLGLSFVDSKGHIDDVTTVAQKLHDKLGPLSQAQRVQALSTIFGSDATRAATVLMNQGAKGLAKYIRATRDQGAAQRMSKAAMSGTSGALERLSGATETAKLALGKSLAPTVRHFANYLSSTAVPKFTKFIDQMQSGKGTGGAVARDLGMIWGAGKKVVSIMGDVAKAIDSMPSWAKKTVGIAGVAAVIGKKTGLLGGMGKPGGLGGVVSKATGVVPVFVTNFGKGGLPGLGGKGSKLPPVAAWKPVPGMSPKGGGVSRFAGFGNAAMNTAGTYAIIKASDLLNKRMLHTRLATTGLTADLKRFGDTGRAGGQLTKTFGDNLGDLSKRAHDFSGASGKINRSMLWLEKISPGNNPMSEANQGFKDIDKSLVKLSKARPGSALNAYRRVLDKTGLSAKDAAKLFPHATKAMTDLQRKMSLVRASRMATDFTHGASKAILLAAALRKTGMSTQDYHKKLSTLPKFVQTKVTTPGAVTSRQQALKLARQYNLTPKQVKTLIALAGVNAAVAAAARARAAYESLHDRTVTLKTVHYSLYVNKHVNVGGGGGGGAGKIGLGIHDATGGHIVGPGTETSDSIPAYLSNNEYVVRAAAVRKYGVSLFDRINAMKFAKGGHAHKGVNRINLTNAQADLLGDLVDGIEKGRVRLSKAISKMAADIAKQADKIKSLISDRRQFAAGFQGMRTSTFSQDFGDQPVTVGTILAMQGQQKAQAQQLQTDVGTVIGKGLSKALVTQFEASGESGIAKLHALAGASGSDIALLNSLDKATSGSLAGAGKQAGGYVYNAKIAAAQSEKRIAEHLEKALKRMRHDGKVEVHIHLTGQEIIRTVRAEKKKHGQKSAI